MMLDEIQTERLRLQRLDIHDASFIKELLNTEGWIQFIGDRKIQSIEDAVAYINRIKSNPDIIYWVVQLKEDQTSVGIISFIKRYYLEHFDIGFAFLPHHSGKGYAYEAANEVLNKVRISPLHEKVLATTFPQNTKSIQLLQKLGLHFDRELEIEGDKLHIYST
jgi:RimJ/RimL family protein N-acetyltransferase